MTDRAFLDALAGRHGVPSDPGVSDARLRGALAATLGCEVRGDTSLAYLDAFLVGVARADVRGDAEREYQRDGQGRFAEGGGGVKTYEHVTPEGKRVRMTIPEDDHSPSRKEDEERKPVVLGRVDRDVRSKMDTKQPLTERELSHVASASRHGAKLLDHEVEHMLNEHMRHTAAAVRAGDRPAMDRLRKINEDIWHDPKTGRPALAPRGDAREQADYFRTVNGQVIPFSGEPGGGEPLAGHGALTEALRKGSLAGKSSAELHAHAKSRDEAARGKRGKAWESYHAETARVRGLAAAKEAEEKKGERDRLHGEHEKAKASAAKARDRFAAASEKANQTNDDKDHKAVGRAQKAYNEKALAQATAREALRAHDRKAKG